MDQFRQKPVETFQRSREKKLNWPDDFINKVICGDCLEIMKEMPDESIDMCITSPPYWGLRDYKVEQIFGGDPDCEHEWGESIIQKQRGTAAGPTAQVGNQKKKIQGTHINQGSFCLKCSAWKGQLGLEPTPELYIEHMTKIFHEVKRVLKKEGTLWLNIGDTYWSAKGSCFNPGGGKNSLETPKKEMGTYPLYRGNKTDIPNLPQKSLCMIPERLAWSLIQDGWILRNKIIWYKPNSMPSSVKDRLGNKWEYLYLFSKNRKYYFDLDAVREPQSPNTHPFGKGGSFEINKDKKTAPTWGIAGTQSLRRKQYHKYRLPGGKNPGDVWTISTCPFPEAHFAVFPEKLIEKPIKAGCPEGEIVLDPFCGSGTACKVAKEMKRNYLGIEINPDYCKMAEKRLAQGVLRSKKIVNFKGEKK